MDGVDIKRFKLPSSINTKNQSFPGEKKQQQTSKKTPHYIAGVILTSTFTILFMWYNFLKSGNFFHCDFILSPSHWHFFSPWNKRQIGTSNPKMFTFEKGGDKKIHEKIIWFLATISIFIECFLIEWWWAALCESLGQRDEQAEVPAMKKCLSLMIKRYS